MNASIAGHPPNSTVEGGSTSDGPRHVLVMKGSFKVSALV
jgi:hypothetical protein